jgi:hypothetical protein
LPQIRSGIVASSFPTFPKSSIENYFIDGEKEFTVCGVNDGTRENSRVTRCHLISHHRTAGLVSTAADTRGGNYNEFRHALRIARGAGELNARIGREVVPLDRSRNAAPRRNSFEGSVTHRANTRHDPGAIVTQDPGGIEPRVFNATKFSREI